MRVYVDSAIHRWRGQLWCHVFSPNLDALHSLMATIGSKREWFQDPSTMAKVSWPHYDANEKRRAAAIAAGAVVVGRHQTVVMSRVVRNVWTGERTDALSRHRSMASSKLPELEGWLRRELVIMGIDPDHHLDAGAKTRLDYTAMRVPAHAEPR